MAKKDAEYKRSDRLGDLLLELVSHLLTREVKDPRIGPVTLTGAEVTDDLRHARIYFSPLARDRETAEVLSGLRSATGFIRTRIAKELKLRFAPAIEFVYDDAQEQARRIDELLRQVKDPQ